jgi:hypothetical protein
MQLESQSRKEVQVPNLAVFRKNICTIGNILPLSANNFPIYLLDKT